MNYYVIRCESNMEEKNCATKKEAKAWAKQCANTLSIFDDSQDFVFTLTRVKETASEFSVKRERI